MLYIDTEIDRDIGVIVIEIDGVIDTVHRLDAEILVIFTIISFCAYFRNVMSKGYSYNNLKVLLTMLITAIHFIYPGQSTKFQELDRLYLVSLFKYVPWRCRV